MHIHAYATFVLPTPQLHRHTAGKQSIGSLILNFYARLAGVTHADRVGRKVAVRFTKLSLRYEQQIYSKHALTARKQRHAAHVHDLAALVMSQLPNRRGALAKQPL